MDKAYLIQVNANDGSSVNTTWEPEIDRFLLARIGAGNATPGELAKISADQKLIIGQLAKGRVPDVLGNLRGPFILAPALRDFIDLMEPGVHRFIPIEIHLREASDKTSPIARHWLLFPPTLVDCLNLDETVLIDDIHGRQWRRVKDDQDPWGGGIPTNEEHQCTLYREHVEGRHLWRINLSRTTSNAEYACSFAFREFFKERGMIGWRFYRSCDLK